MSAREAARGLVIHAFSRYGEGSIAGWNGLARVGRRFEEDFSGSPAFPAALSRALARPGLKQGPLRLPRASVSDLARAAELFPSPWALALDGVALYLSRRLEDAEARFEALAAAAPDWPWSLVLLAESRLYLGPARRALPELARARALAPGWAWPFMLEGRALFSAGDRACLEPLERATRLSPRMALAAGWRGHALASLGSAEQGISELSRAEALDPGYARACAWRGLHLARAGRRAEALAALERSLELDPYYPPAHLSRAEVLLAEGRGAQAAQAVRDLAECCLRAQWLANAASVHFLKRERDLSRARRLCEAAAAAAPSSPWPAFWLGQTLLAQGEYAAAESALAAALARGLPPRRRPWALAWRGRALMRQSRPAEARRSLDAALAGSSRPAWALVWRAELSLSGGRTAEAARDAAAAVAADPDLADAWSALSFAREALGDAPGALAACERASSLQPLWSEAKRRRLALAGALSRWDAALSALRALGPAAGGLAGLAPELERRRRQSSAEPLVVATGAVQEAGRV